MIEYSVVTTVFNDANEILSFLDDMCLQTVNPKEIIIADGGSNDRTCEIISSYDNREVNIVLLQDGRLNVSEGFNLAIKHSTTEYIGVVGVGNVYNNDFFEHLLNSIIENKVDLSYAVIRGLDVTDFSKMYNRTILDGDKGQRMNIASNHGVLIKKSIFEDIGYFYENFIFAGEDAEFYDLVRIRGYKSFMDENGRAPNYIQYGGSYLAYPDLVYNFARISENHHG